MGQIVGRTEKPGPAFIVERIQVTVRPIVEKVLLGRDGVRKKLSGLSPWFKSMLTGKKGLILQSTEAAPANQDCQTGRINAQTSGQDCKS